MFKEALIKSTKQLSKLKKDGSLSGFALIGGMALAAYLEPRATADIDYVIQLGSKDLNKIGALLMGEVRKGDVYDPLAGSISFSIKSSQGSVPIQLIQMHPALEKISICNVDTLKINGTPVPIVNRRGLILLKLYAGGSVDIEDAKRLLSSKELEARDRKYIRTKAHSLRLTSRLNRVFR